MWATPPCLLQKDIPGMKVFGLFHKDAQDSNDRRFRIKEESGYNTPITTTIKLKT